MSHKLAVGNELSLTFCGAVVKIRCLDSDRRGAQLQITATRDMLLELPTSVALQSKNAKLNDNGGD
jgi:hypothetical protein